MPKLRRLSGAEVIRIFGQFGFVIHSQKGSHVKLSRLNASGERQTLTVPNHTQIDTGTARAILRQATRYIPEEQLHEFFYTD